MTLKLPDPYREFAKPQSLRLAEAATITVWIMLGWLGTFLGLAAITNALELQVGLPAHAILTTFLVVVAMYLSVKALQRLWGWSK